MNQDQLPHLASSPPEDASIDPDRYAKMVEKNHDEAQLAAMTRRMREPAPVPLPCPHHEAGRDEFEGLSDQIASEVDA